MGYTLLVDDNETTYKTLRPHFKAKACTLRHAKSVGQAWEQVTLHPEIDLVILDLNLESETGLSLIKKLRTDLIFEKLPIIVYTVNTTRNTVVQVLNSGIQNYLLKPCKPQQILEELEKAKKRQWRQRFFEDAKSITSHNGYTLREYIVQLDEAQERINKHIQQINRAHLEEKLRNASMPLQRLKLLGKQIGFTLLQSIVNDLSLSVKQSSYDLIPEGIHNLDTCQKLLADYITVLLKESSSRNDQGDRKTPRTPTREIVLEKLESLDNLPAYGNLAEVFQSATQNIDLDLERVVQLVRSDPGLSSQVISFANSAFLHTNAPIDDIEVAMQMLGYRRIQLIAMSFQSSLQRRQLFQAFDWRSFWINQAGCAMICEEILETLNAPPLNHAYMAGLLRGIGQMILSNYFPEHYKNAVDYAQQYSLPLAEAEIEVFGISHEELGAKYAQNHNFPEAITMAIGHQSSPEKAQSHQELAAVLNIAVFLSLKYQVGRNGMPPIRPLQSLHHLEAWNIVKEWANPRMAVENFEAHMTKHIKRIRGQLEAQADEISYSIV